MKRFDIRKDDVVQFKTGLSEEDKERIVKFAGSVGNQPELKAYTREFIHPSFHFKVRAQGQTKRIPTEYVSLETKDGVYIYSQTRYLQ